MSPTAPTPQRISETVWTLPAPNPGPMTLDGTNSYLIGDRGSGVIVVDPGPDDPGHLDRLAAHAPIALILLTHRHPDHTDGIAGLVERTGAVVRAADPDFCVNAPPLVDQEVVEAAGVGLTVVGTAGHTTDSVCFRLTDGAGSAMLTGDTVLGRGTTVIAHPDGRLGPYLDSLRRLADLGPATVLPGHGPVLPDLAEACRMYLAHRQDRLEQVRAAVRAIHAAGRSADVAAVTDAVYTDIDPLVRPAAERSVAAQLEYLAPTSG